MLHRKNKGLTLIELIVCIGLLMVILLSVTLMIRPITGLFHLDMSTNSIMELRNYISEQISDELRLSKSLQVYEYSDDRVSNAENCIYVNEDGYIMVKRNGNEPELMYDEEFYGNYTVDLYFQVMDNRTSLLLEVDIYDPDMILVDECETGIELLNIDTNSIVYESSQCQVVVFE